MGMSTHVKGYVSPENETYQKHLKVFRACLEAGISLPDETAQYFGQGKHPYEGMEISKLETKVPVHQYSEDMLEGYEIIVSEIPKDVHKIRFYNAW